MYSLLGWGRHSISKALVVSNQEVYYTNLNLMVLDQKPDL